MEITRNENASTLDPLAVCVIQESYIFKYPDYLYNIMEAHQNSFYLREDPLISYNHFSACFPENNELSLIFGKKKKKMSRYSLYVLLINSW